METSGRGDGPAQADMVMHATDGVSLAGHVIAAGSNHHATPTEKPYGGRSDGIAGKYAGGHPEASLHVGLTTVDGGGSGGLAGAPGKVTEDPSPRPALSVGSREHGPRLPQRPSRPGNHLSKAGSATGGSDGSKAANGKPSPSFSATGVSSSKMASSSSAPSASNSQKSSHAVLGSGAMPTLPVRTAPAAAFAHLPALDSVIDPMESPSTQLVRQQVSHE